MEEKPLTTSEGVGVGGVGELQERECQSSALLSLIQHYSFARLRSQDGLSLGHSHSDGYGRLYGCSQLGEIDYHGSYGIMGVGGPNVFLKI